MAGVRSDDELDFDEALGIASFQVMMGHVPPATAWVDGLAEQADAAKVEAFAENFF